MIHQAVTTLEPGAVLQRAKQFFTERLLLFAAYPEREGPTYLTLRGQGGEEIAIAAWEANGQTRVRASTLLFDQSVMRFLSTLPPGADPA